MAAINPTEASRAVLVELGNVLGAFRADLVVVGGWVPELLYPGRGHVGSLDVDLAVAASARAGNAYQTIRRCLTEAGYHQEVDPTRFLKVVPGAQEPVKVDLISGQYGTGPKAAALLVDELPLSCLRGVDLAFEWCDEVTLTGRMPDGAINTVRVRVVRPEAFILIKSFALDERAKDKDAYDVAFVLEHYQPSLSALADRVRGMLGNGLARQAHEILQVKFAAIDAVGPVWAARVAESAGREFEQARRAAFENAQELFRHVGPLPPPTGG